MSQIDITNIHAPRFGLGAVYHRDGRDWLCVEAPWNGDEVLIQIPDGETALGFGRTWFRDDAHRRWMDGQPTLMASRCERALVDYDLHAGTLICVLDIMEAIPA